MGQMTSAHVYSDRATGCLIVETPRGSWFFPPNAVTVTLLGNEVTARDGQGNDVPRNAFWPRKP